MRGVETFEDFLRAVGEPAVTEKETESSKHEIFLMVLYDAVGHEDRAGTIIVAMPEGAADKTAELKRAIVFRIGEGFVMAVAPAKAAERAHLRSNFLVEVQFEAVFMATLAAG